MRLAPLASLALFAGACGPPQSEFVGPYAEGWCEHVLACEDEAQLTFDGILTVEDCVLRYNESINDLSSRCAYQPSFATQCLADVETLSCPSGDPRTADLPLSCESVYINCSAGSDTLDEEATSSL